MRYQFCLLGPIYYTINCIMFDYLNSDIKQIFARIQGKAYQNKFICQEISFFVVLMKFLDFIVLYEKRE